MQLQHRVTTAFRGVDKVDHHKGFVWIPENAVLTIEDGGPSQGLIAVSWEGRDLLVFAQDLQEHTKEHQK